MRQSAPGLAPRRTLQLVWLGFALLLPFVTWPEAAFGVSAALLFAWSILPQIDAGPGRQSGGSGADQVARSGVALYLTSALALILIFRHHLDVAAAAWALMALGDGAATICGQTMQSPALPWNPCKTAAGFAGFVVAGTAGALAFTLWVNPSLPAGKTLLISVLAAVLGAGVESAPIRLDDNVTVPWATGGFIFCAWLAAMPALASNLPYLGLRMALAVAVDLTFALLAWQLRAASRSGAAMGFVLGVLVYLGWGWKSFLILLAFFVLASASTRLGYNTKLARGVAEARAGARSWREALANLGPGAFFSILVIITHHERAFLAAFVAAFAEAAGDTVSSEIGQWLAADAWLVTKFRKVPAGESGAVSLPGSLAGLAAAVLIAGLGRALGLVTIGGAGLALAAAVTGNLVDSLLGATLERRGLITNGVVNFVGTAFAGGLALSITLR